MIKLTVLYGPPKDVAAFEDYYASTHMPLVYKIPGLGRTEKAKVKIDLKPGRVRRR